MKTVTKDSTMSTVWTISEGGIKESGEKLIAILATYDSAIKELERMAGDTIICKGWTTSSFGDGRFYTILRHHNLQA